MNKFTAIDMMQDAIDAGVTSAHEAYENFADKTYQLFIKDETKHEEMEAWCEELHEKLVAADLVDNFPENPSVKENITPAEALIKLQALEEPT